MITQDEQIIIHNPLTESIGYHEVVYGEAAVADLRAENARLTARVETLEESEAELKLYKNELDNPAQAQYIKADRDKWRARVEALERALKLYTECSVCLFENDRKAKCCDSRNCKWQFDEARFAGK